MQENNDTNMLREIRCCGCAFAHAWEHLSRVRSCGRTAHGCHDAHGCRRLAGKGFDSVDEEAAFLSVALIFEIAALRIFVSVCIIEDEKKWGDDQNIANGWTFLARYDDELHREAIARRADRGDTDLDLVQAFRKLDKETLALARTKLADTVETLWDLAGQATATAAG